MDYGICKIIEKGTQESKEEGQKLFIKNNKQRGFNTTTKREEDNINKNWIIGTEDKKDKEARGNKEEELISIDQIQQEISRVRSFENGRRKEPEAGVFSRTYQDIRYWIFVGKIGAIVIFIQINIFLLLHNYKIYKDL